MFNWVGGEACTCSFVEVAHQDASLEAIGDRFDEREACDDGVEVDVRDCDNGDIEIVYEVTMAILGLVDECQSCGNDWKQPGISSVWYRLARALLGVQYSRCEYCHDGNFFAPFHLHIVQQISWE